MGVRRLYPGILGLWRLSRTEESYAESTRLEQVLRSEQTDTEYIRLSSLQRDRERLYRFSIDNIICQWVFFRETIETHIERGSCKIVVRDFVGSALLCFEYDQQWIAKFHFERPLIEGNIHDTARIGFVDVLLWRGGGFWRFQLRNKLRTRL